MLTSLKADNCLKLHKNLERRPTQRYLLKRKCSKRDVKGVLIASQTKGNGQMSFRLQRCYANDIFGCLVFDNWEKENEKSDEWALANGYASVVPVKVDMTHYELIDQLKHWEKEVVTR